LNALFSIIAKCLKDSWIAKNVVVSDSLAAKEIKRDCREENNCKSI